MAFDPAPLRLAEVIDPSWLSAMLSQTWPGTSVEGVEVVETLITQATKVRLKLDLSGPHAANTPNNFCIKGILTDTGAPGSASVVETRYYRECAANLPVHVPACVHAELNTAQDRGIIVMHDVIEAGASFGTALRPFAVADTCFVIDQLAQLHAATWQGTGTFEAAWVPRFLDQIGSKQIVPLTHLQQMLDGPKGELLPAAIKDAERLQRAIQTLAAQVRSRASCLVHGDAHAGNIFARPHADGSSGFGLVDWQIFQQGEWAQDVAYHVAAALSPETRRIHERPILEYYCERLTANGGPALNRDDAWDRYRAAMVYGYFLWSITQKVEPDITREFVHRLGTAVADLDSYCVLDC